MKEFWNFFVYVGSKCTELKVYFLVFLLTLTFPRSKHSELGLPALYSIAL